MNLALFHIREVARTDISLIRIFNCLGPVSYFSPSQIPSGCVAGGVCSGWWLHGCSILCSLEIADGILHPHTYGLSLWPIVTNCCNIPWVSVCFLYRKKTLVYQQTPSTDDTTQICNFCIIHLIRLFHPSIFLLKGLKKIYILFPFFGFTVSYSPPLSLLSFFFLLQNIFGCRLSWIPPPPPFLLLGCDSCCIVPQGVSFFIPVSQARQGKQLQILSVDELYPPPLECYQPTLSLESQQHRSLSILLKLLNI